MRSSPRQHVEHGKESFGEKGSLHRCSALSWRHDLVRLLGNTADVVQVVRALTLHTQ